MEGSLKSSADSMIKSIEGYLSTDQIEQLEDILTFPPAVLQDAPNAREVYSSYDKLKTPKINKPLYDECSENIEKQWKMYSRKLTYEELQEANTTMTRKATTDLLSIYFPEMRVIHVTITIYKNKTQYIEIIQTDGHNMITKTDEELIPIMISVNYNGSDSRQTYVENLEEYYRVSKGIGSEGDIELYFSSTKYLGSHANLAVWDTYNDKYDFFDTAHTPIGHHRVAMALKYFINITESKLSKSLAFDKSVLCSRCSNLQGEHTKEILCRPNNLCTLWTIAYLLARYVCYSHLSIETYFREMNKSNPMRLNHLIAGLKR